LARRGILRSVARSAVRRGARGADAALPPRRRSLRVAGDRGSRRGFRRRRFQRRCRGDPARARDGCRAPPALARARARGVRSRGDRGDGAQGEGARSSAAARSALLRHLGRPGAPGEARGLGPGSRPRAEIGILLHFEEGGRTGEAVRFFDRLRSRNVRFDAVGLSYYPWWHGSLDSLAATVNALARAGRLRGPGSRRLLLVPGGDDGAASRIALGELRPLRRPRPAAAFHRGTHGGAAPAPMIRADLRGRARA